MNLDVLNEGQKDALAPDQNILLTACPGSGKTRVLIYKVALELEKIQNQK